jgi:3-oxoacyl-[acyl-carrier-protein] synthase 3 protein 2
MYSAKIVSVGSYVPQKVVDNEQLSYYLDTTDEWIKTRTGILQRHIADGQSTGELAVEAARRAISRIPDGKIDLLLLATTTPDRLCPATAPFIATELELGNIPAFDISAVCSGFVYSLYVAAGLVRSGQVDHVLIIGSDTITRLLCPRDRSTVPLFGDGAGAIVIGRGHAGDPGEILEIELGSDGRQIDAITVAPTDSPDTPSYLHMDGQKVFRSAVRRMTDASRVVMQRAGWHPSEVDWLIAHQANIRIISAVGKNLGVDDSHAVINLHKVGNTSAASIPLAMDYADRKGILQSGQKILMTAFGGGTTWGAAALTWPKL